MKDMKDMKGEKHLVHTSINLNYLIDEVQQRDKLEVFYDNKKERWLNKKETITELKRLKSVGFECIPLGDCNNYTDKGSCNWHKVSG